MVGAVPVLTRGRSQGDKEQDQAALPNAKHRPEWKFHTQNRNLLVKHFNKSNNILTTKKNPLQLQMFRSLVKQQEHLRVKTEETTLGCFGVSVYTAR